MIFEKNEKLTELLKKAFENKEDITIEGVNGIGAKFKTTGRIAGDDNGEAEIYEKALVLQFDFNKNNLIKNPKERISTFFQTLREEDVYLFDPSLYIFTIYDSNGNIIYNNPNKDKLLEETKLFSEVKHKQDIKEKRNLIELDDVTKKLFDYIGKPIIIVEDGTYQSGVLACVNGANNYGRTMIDIRVATLCGGLSIGENTALYTVNKNNDIELVADNSLNENNRDIILKRIERRYEDFEMNNL